MKHALTLLVVLLLTPSSAIRSAERGVDTCDVVVYGATPAGIAAALAAAEEGRSVLLVEPTGRIGGMVTHGLSHSDFHSFESLNGPFYRFSQQVLKHYRTTYAADSAQANDSFRGTHGEPSVNLRVFQAMLEAQSSISVLTSHRLTDVMVENETITGVTFGAREVRPRVVIDATYEGDLLAAAGVPFRVGREARSEYNESLAPETADEQLQGYNFRLCMTQRADIRVPIPVPANYRRDDYADIVALVESGQIASAFGYPGSKFLLKAHLPIMPNGKHDINDVSKGLVRLSMPDHNRSYPEGDLATRRRIEQEHLDWQLGLIHFAQTDPALPEAFRQEASTWGLCRDEFTETEFLPPQIYVREARRMTGLHVYTENDTDYAPNDARAKFHCDSIAVGEYSHNCHGTGHQGPRIGGRHTGEFYKAVAPYQIPYGVLVPKEMRNLIVPVACSSSHVGFCALRLEPIWMSLGGAAGYAASQAIGRNVSVQQIDVAALQARIQASGGATIHVSDVPPNHPDFAAVQWWGTLGGLHGIEPAPEKLGTRGAHLVSQYFGAFPGHAVELEKLLDEDLAGRWTKLARDLHLPVERLAEVNGKTTRGDWIRAASAAAAEESVAQRVSWEPVDMGTLRELFVDDLMIGKLDGTQLKMHQPHRLRRTPQRPFGHYATVLPDGNKLRLYYRGDKVPGAHWRDGWGKYHEGEVTLYAESVDGGIHWTEPDLGIHNVPEMPAGNVVVDMSDDTFLVTHNFTPFIDARPGVPADQRYKALGGGRYPPQNWGGWKTPDERQKLRDKYGPGGLKAFASADGLHWRLLRKEPVLPEDIGSFDSQNGAFWSEAEQQYVCYFRWFDKGRRAIRRSTSKDFLNWTDPVDMQANAPGEHLYTSCTQPYFRAPHIYIALPTRFQASKGAITDIVLMATRPGGHRYHRHFKEAFIRPGLGESGWGNRANYITQNVVQTSPTEMSMFMYGGGHYVLRLDGFISINAGFDEGEFITKPLKFSGARLEINYSTSGAGRIRVELQDADGEPLPGFTLEQCDPIKGDAIAGVVTWEERSDVSQIAGNVVRVRFVMNEADVYSFVFPRESSNP